MSLGTSKTRGVRAKTSAGNKTGQSLHELIFQTIRDETLSHVQNHEAKTTKNNFAQYRNDPERFIKEVLKEKVTPDIKELLESVRDNVVTQGRSANGVGKTHGAARAIIWFFFCYLGEGVQVYTFAAPPEENLKKLLWGEISNIVNKNPALFTNLKVRLSSLDISSPDSNEFITGVAIPQSGDPAAKKARFSGKHSPFLMFVGDEADAVPAEIHEAIDSCMSGGHARELLLFNPRSANGAIYQMAKRGEAHVVPLSAFTHPNVVTGKDVFPGAVTREVTAQRINKWTRSLYPGEPLDSEVFMVPNYLNGYVATKQDGKTQYPPIKGGEFRKITEPAFSYMVLGKYSSQAEDQLIDRADVKRARERWSRHVALHGEVPPNRINPVMSLDVADMGKDRNVLFRKYDSWVARPEIWVGVDNEVTTNKALLEYRKWDATEIFIDSNGVGAGVWPRLRTQGCTAHRIMPQETATDVAKTDGEVIGQFYRVRDQAWWAMREWIRTDPNCMLPDDDELEDELCSATYGRLQGKIKICENDVMKERLGGNSPDLASGLMQMFAPKNDGDEGAEMYSENYMY